jgi:hypothetical protein
VHEALDISEAVLFAELMTFAVLFTVTRLDGIPRSMPLVHGLLLAGGLLAARVLVRIVASEDDEPPGHQCRRERIILVGANRFASSFIQLLNACAPQQRGKTKVGRLVFRNASWLDLRIAMMTVELLLRGRVSSHEILADTEQVRSKANSGEDWFAETRLNAQ